MQDFRKLKVWEKAHALVLRVYPATADFPQHELFGLRAHLRRASFQIAERIAEGCSRETDQEFARSLYAAVGCAGETEYLVLLARDLSYITTEQHDQLTADVIEVKRMLCGLLGTLSR